MQICVPDDILQLPATCAYLLEVPRIFTYYIALLREHLYQAYERPVRPQIYDLVAETKRTFDDLKSTTGRR